MSNHYYVCFECRTALRRPHVYGRRKPAPNCPECGQRCTFVTYKLAIPPKRHKYAWRQLQAVMRQYRQERCAFFDSRPYERLAALEHQFRAWNAKLNCAQTENQRNAFRRETARCLQAMADIEKEINVSRLYGAVSAAPIRFKYQDIC